MQSPASLQPYQHPFLLTTMESFQRAPADSRLPHQTFPRTTSRSCGSCGRTAMGKQRRDTLLEVHSLLLFESRQTLHGQFSISSRPRLLKLSLHHLCGSVLTLPAQTLSETIQRATVALMFGNLSSE